MTYFAWDPKLATGCEAIDKQHQGLFDLANALERAIEQDSDDEEALANAVYGLVDYVVEHFKDEESYMEEHHYPGIGPHRALHEQLAAETLGLTARYINGEKLAPKELAPMVCDWLTGHIMRHDMAVVEFVERSNAVASGVGSGTAGQR